MTFEEMLMMLIASGGDTKGGVNSMMSAFTNPIYGAMVGGFDPLTMTRGPGQTWTSYSSVQDQDLQDVMSLIQEGAQELDVKTYIDRKYSENPQAFAGLGMLSDDVYKLGRELVNEYASAQEQSDVFAKAGLPSPIEMYTPETVPLSGKAYEKSAELMKLFAEREQKALSASAQADVTSRQLSEFEDKNKKVLQAYANRLSGGSGVNPMSAGGKEPDFYMWNGKEKIPVYGAKFEQNIIAKSAKKVARSGAAGILEAMGVVAEPSSSLALGMRTGGSSKTSKPTSQEEAQKMQIMRDYWKLRQANFQAKERAHSERMKAQKIAKQEEAIRRGYLQALEAQGRTPFLDTAATRMAMFQMLK